jgi:DNA-binding CsgD family transcriptional regulator
LEIFSGGQTRLDRSSIEKLSDREFEVFESMGEGLSSQQIAKKLHLSAKTVDAHRANIKTKLGIKTTAELISYAARWTSHQAQNE